MLQRFGPTHDAKEVSFSCYQQIGFRSTFSFQGRALLEATQPSSLLFPVLSDFLAFTCRLFLAELHRNQTTLSSLFHPVHLGLRSKGWFCLFPDCATWQWVSTVLGSSMQSRFSFFLRIAQETSFRYFTNFIYNKQFSFKSDHFRSIANLFKHTLIPMISFSSFSDETIKRSSVQ